MLKLSNPDYFLPIVFALQPGKILSSGTTMPQLINGVCEQTGIRSDYVVKYTHASRMSPEASARELVAALIARELGFTVPEPVVVHITEEFVSLMKNSENYLVAKNSIGFNFGNEFKRGYLPIIDGQPVNEMLSLKLAELFAFDVFIGNPDRRIDKPNFLSNGEDILIFDHELAFSFVLELPFMRNKQPWIVRESDKNWITRHYCYKRISENQFDFSIFTNKLSVIDNLFCAKLETIMPAEWLTDQLGDIKTYLILCIEKAHLFSDELNRIRRW